ncbi:energy-coupling factor transporter transmembrane component T family protein [Janibacter limosus]|uniref:energy-coupling factor transporter transmembrane component T family protein n=1 Tax=Janibacter limosus TaxID=53458 RepID=UPI00083557C6|nr:energy-coupling factor transporter transmembrane protein EcfT [Janibacter limosus]
MIGLYRDGDSLLHRLPAGAKLAGLLLAGLASPFVRSSVVTAAALALVVAGYAIARMPPRVLLQMLRPLLFVMVPLGVFQTVVAGWERAFVIVGVLVALVLLANLVTLSTRTSDLIDVVVRVCSPLRRVGVNPERVGLMLQLATRAVPLVIDLGRRVREAQHARGLGASPRAFAVPLIVGALRRADAMGDALAARGFDD